MKKIAIASAAMGGAALIAFGASGTFAEFTDSGRTAGSAGAGTLVLSASESIATEAESLGLAPGESTRLTFPVENAGSVDGLLTAVGTVVDAADDCSSASEADVDDCETATAGDFSATAGVAVYQVDGLSAAECDAETSVAGARNITPGYTMAQLHDASVPLYPLAAGDVTCFVIDVSLDQDVDNVVQGDEASLSVSLTLEQDMSPAPADV